MVTEIFCILTISMPKSSLQYCMAVLQDVTLGETRMYKGSLYYFLEVHGNLQLPFLKSLKKSDINIS